MRGVPGCVCLFLAAGLAAVPVGASDDRMEVPGGTHAVARLIGHVDSDPERFTESLNRALLAGIAAGDDWRLVRKRVELVEYLAVVSEVEERFGAEIRLRGRTDLQPTYEELSAVLGYRYTRSDTGPVVEPTIDDRGEFGRLTARALDWDVHDIGTRLRNNETVVLTLTHDQAPTPLPIADWKDHTGLVFEAATALEVMAMDQRLCLLAEGLRRVSDETRSYLERDGLLARVYMHSAASFYRYAASLTVRNGALVVPGGPDSAAAWAEVARADPADPHAFLRALLRPGQVRLLYLWHALSFLPDREAAFYTAHLQTWFRNLVKIDPVIHVAAARGEGPGFAALARSLPISPDTGRLDLPGGNGVWAEAMRGEIRARKEAKLAKSAAKAFGQEVPDDRVVSRTMERSADVVSGQSPALTRVIHTVNAFREHPEVLSPENVLLLARATERYPMALASLERLDLRDPETIRTHLLAVAHLDGLGHDADKFVLIANFQGGVELLVALTIAGHVPPADIERLLQDWNRIHREATSPFDAAPEQLAWLTALAEALPAAPDDAPGRGPAEAAWLSALVPRHDIQWFSWRGLDYVGHRGRDQASRMADHAVRQGIPALDDLIGIHASFSALLEACSTGDLEGAAAHASAAAGQWARLPPGDLGPLPNGEYYRDWLEPVDRARGLRALKAFGGVKDPGRLPKMADDALTAEGLMAREIRPLLLSTVYLIGMGEMDSLLFREVNLIRKHTPIRYVKIQGGVAVDTPWERTDFAPGLADPIGSHFSGHIGGVAHGLREFHAAGASNEGSGTISDTRSRGFRDALSTPWYALGAWHARAVAALVAGGDGILARAADGDADARRFVVRRVPDARFERWAQGRGGVISPSDRFQIGLAAFEGDRFGPSFASLLDPENRATIDALAAERDGTLREPLRMVGSPTPALNGRRHRWVGTWTPYEAVQDERGTEPIVEREIVDLRIAVLDHLGRRGIPGHVAADLIRPILADMPEEVDPATDRDWETVIRWITSMDDVYFEERLRQCMVDGLYRLQ